MAKKIILLPLAVLICFSLNAGDWSDQKPPYNYDLYNYYTERPWLLPPGEYHRYLEMARLAPVQNNYNNYNYNYSTYTGKPVQDDLPAAPSVALPPASWAADVRVSDGRVSDVRLPDVRVSDAATSDVRTPDVATSDETVSDVPPGSTALQFDPSVKSNYRFQDLESPDSRPGYQGLPWGTTIAQFQSRFRDAEEVTGVQNDSPRVRRFAQQSVDDGIQARQFLFLDDRLYEVYVLYGYVEDEITSEMQKRLEALYGQPVDTIRRADKFNDVKYDIADMYMGNTREMQVVLSICAVSDDDDTPQGTIMTCLFSNPQVRK